jgi:hypothetical protein
MVLRSALPGAADNRRTSSRSSVGIGSSGPCSLSKPADVGLPDAGTEVAPDVDAGEVSGDFAEQDGTVGGHLMRRMECLKTGQDTDEDANHRDRYAQRRRRDHSP